ncbi:MAG: hypothetical protein J6A07_08965 [Firmicutes bacterium]|nr:hypothetical protein [Bacillota bacterium]
MTRTEFVKYLDKRLAVLNENEREDIKQELMQHIDIKIQDGMTEEEAIESFGDIHALVDEMLGAYNIDPNYGEKPKSEFKQKAKEVLNSDFAKNVSEKANDGLNKVHTFVQSSTPAEVLLAVIKVVAAFLLAFIVFGIGYFVTDAAARIVHAILPSRLWFDDIVANGLRILYVLFFAVVAITVIGSMLGKQAENITAAAKAANPGSSESTSAKFLDIAVFVIRVVVFFAILPVMLSLVGMFAVQGILLVTLFSGYPTLGLNILCFGIILCTLAFVMLVLKLVFLKKEVGKVEN